MKIRACVLTFSDKGAAGLRTDESGPAVRAMLEAAGMEVAHYEVMPDALDPIKVKLCEMAAVVDLIVTTGGTGLSPRDVAPEATLGVIHRRVPGIAEAMRAASMRKTNRAMLSRAEAGVRGACLIVNLPGSLKAARENLEAVIDVLPHAIDKIKGSTDDCGG